MENFDEFDDYRDRISTIGTNGKRVWVYPKKPKGKLYNYRKITALFLLAFFFLAPFIKIDGEPFLLFNVLERKFILFGFPFFPQDFYLLVPVMIAFIVFVVLFTVVYGRIFCGWLCPQTIFMEFVYRQIEYWIEGNNKQQRRLDLAPLNFNKLWRKGLKHFLFYFISFITIVWFLAYIIGMDQVFRIFTADRGSNLALILGVVVFSGVHFLVFAKLREQVCVIICPYGRLQGVLLDRNSIVVSYDYNRGEPRGIYKPHENRATAGKGDCVECSSCVQVCPTGIDIRHGTQLECINCTACIDACNGVMKRMNKPQGLIRYASERSIADTEPLRFNVRILLYSFVLLGLLTLTGFLFSERTELEASILRMSGTMYQEYDAQHYSNIYVIQVVNKTRNTLPVEIELIQPGGEIKMMGGELNIEKGKVGKADFLLVLDKNVVKKSLTNVKFRVLANGREMDVINTSFVGPNSLDRP
ncbi:MAG: cytochrome c oxidase accessory protein CcoG [Lentimicrobiaceae bacterium]|nr:cytochrome c oxidase accessory protein CcoG [Lentimicrobiaceae bacterium]